MNLRTRACFTLSRWLMPTPAERTVDYGAYDAWRTESLSKSWGDFPDSHIAGKDVLDFGCGDGQLSMFLACQKGPRSVTGVDLNTSAIERASKSLRDLQPPPSARVEFRVGSMDGLPVPDRSVDTLVAFDCLEHVMSPGPILKDWYRVLRPGGRCLIEWYPYKGPWGPHMESLIPIPWAHVLFGEQAMLRTAERIYDLPEFKPRHWDIGSDGKKRPNKWRAWSTFEEQGYINKLDIASFERLSKEAGFVIDRLDARSFGGSPARQSVGKALMRTPWIGEYFMSFALIELIRPS